MTVAGSAETERADFWRATFRVWTIAFAVGLALTGATVLLQAADDGTKLRALALLGAFVLAYVILAVPGVRRGNPWLTHGYLAVVVVLTSLSVLNSPLSTVLLFLVYAQVWFFGSSRRVSLAFTLVLTIGVFGTFAWLGGFTAEATREALVQGGFAALFSTLLGLWVTYIAEQSEVRAELLAELERTQAALALSSHDAGVMAERERMAGEIHDTLAQGFASIVMLAQAAASDLEREQPAEAAERLRLVESTARDNLAEARALVAAFAPVGLTEATLAEALERLTARFSAETGIAVDLELPGAPVPLDREREVVVLRVTQEALTNVRRHSAASSARVRLEATPEGGALLEVADDGRGIEAERAEGFGLRGMRERVTASGGSLELATPPRGGTIVRVTLVPAKELA